MHELKLGHSTKLNAIGWKEVFIHAIRKANHLKSFIVTCGLISCLLMIAGCAASAVNSEVEVQEVAYGPQNKVSIFIHGLKDSEFTNLVSLMIGDSICKKMVVLERTFEYCEINCKTIKDTDQVANAFQSSAQKLKLNLTVSHAGDHVIMRVLKP